MLNKNIGMADRVIRIVVGVALIAAAATGRVGWWGWIGVVPLLTATVRICPLYSILGLRT
jgi:hypothetical protein